MNNPPPGMSELPEMAALALRLADTGCSDACREYHAVWGFLRLFGRLPAVTADHGFLSRSIGEAVAAGARRVLVCGAADHGLLAYVLAAFGPTGPRPDVTVIDLCPTPLAVCRAYAGLHGVAIATEATDALRFRAAPFDLILAHNVLNFFAPEGRAELVARWGALLAPGGRIVSCTTLKPGAAPMSRRFGPREAEGLARRLAADRADSPHAGLIAEPRLLALAAGFAAKRVSWNVTRIEELEGYFVQAGLHPEMSIGRNPGGMTRTSQGKKQRIGVVARHAQGSAAK
ncbi:class I SAM-dependent methyltransferase [Vannielia litorea]|uniref:Methyltransferase domain-containing protein n=1 Tax=Vannielia litorea TaxID=1217970 RepID=A0A1N6GHM9_9RHOB|nr:class I SAM-dependent methyltransferase [Vannielia litorea]SIO07049.1 Methyltransferase domain-containing protein [Vannielia litorea]